MQLIKLINQAKVKARNFYLPTNNLWLLFLAPLLLIGLVATVAISSAYFGLFREDLQTAVFPIAAVLIYLVAKQFRLQLPGWIFFAGAVLWGIGALNVRGYLPSFSSSSSLYISRLTADPTTLRARQLVSHVNLVSRQYNLPRATLLHRAFTTDNEASDWLQEEREAAVVVRGSPTWLRVVFDQTFTWGSKATGRAQSTNIGSDTDSDTDAVWLSRLMAELNLVDGRGVRTVAADGQKLPLIAVEVPEGADLPSEPIALSQHYLAWLGHAFSPASLFEKKFPEFFQSGATSSTATSDRVAINELRGSFLQLASDVQGEWRSSEPRALALFLRGTKELLEAANQNVDAGPMDCAMNLLARAQRVVQADHAAEVYAAVNNNLAVACLLHEARPFSCQMLLRWLREASEVVDQRGQLVRGAKAAYINLLAMRREGLY